MLTRRQNRSSNANEALNMRPHEACFWSMMRTTVPDALEAMGQPHVDLSMSSRAKSCSHRYLTEGLQGSTYS